MSFSPAVLTLTAYLDAGDPKDADQGLGAVEIILIVLAVIVALTLLAAAVKYLRRG